MKPLVIGQAPSRTSDPTKPLAGEPLASRLAALFGMDVESYLAATDRRNLLGAWPGKSSKGDRFPIAEARRMAFQIDLDGRHVLFVGIATAAAFGPEAVRKAAEGQRGRKLSAECRRKISEALRGRQFTPEWREKMSLAHSGKPLSKEYVANAAAAHLGMKYNRRNLK